MPNEHEHSFTNAVRKFSGEIIRRLDRIIETLGGKPVEVIPDRAPKKPLWHQPGDESPKKRGRPKKQRVEAGAVVVPPAPPPRPPVQDDMADVSIVYY